MNNIFKYLIFICLFTECIDFLMLKIIKDQESLFKFSALFQILKSTIAQLVMSKEK